MIQASDEDILLEWSRTEAEIFLNRIKEQLYKTCGLPNSALATIKPTDLYYNVLQTRNDIYDTEL